MNVYFLNHPGIFQRSNIRNEKENEEGVEVKLPFSACMTYSLLIF